MIRIRARERETAAPYGTTTEFGLTAQLAQLGGGLRWCSIKPTHPAQETLHAFYCNAVINDCNGEM